MREDCSRTHDNQRRDWRPAVASRRRAARLRGPCTAQGQSPGTGGEKVALALPLGFGDTVAAGASGVSAQRQAPLWVFGERKYLFEKMLDTRVQTLGTQARNF